MTRAFEISNSCPVPVEWPGLAARAQTLLAAHDGQVTYDALGGLYPLVDSLDSERLKDVEGYGLAQIIVPLAVWLQQPENQKQVINEVLSSLPAARAMIYFEQPPLWLLDSGFFEAGFLNSAAQQAAAVDPVTRFLTDTLVLADGQRVRAQRGELERMPGHVPSQEACEAVLEGKRAATKIGRNFMIGVLGLYKWYLWSAAEAKASEAGQGLEAEDLDTMPLADVVEFLPGPARGMRRSATGLARLRADEFSRAIRGIGDEADLLTYGVDGEVDFHNSEVADAPPPLTEADRQLGYFSEQRHYCPAIHVGHMLQIVLRFTPDLLEAVSRH